MNDPIRVDPRDVGAAALSDVDRLAAFVLGRMLASTDTLARRKAMARIDPWLRAAVRRRVEAALDDAVRVSPDLDEAHRRRLALLDVLDASPALDRARDVDLVEALARAAAPRVPDAPGPWRRSIAALAVVLALVASVLAYVGLRDKPYAALEPTGVARADAYRRGGRPLGDERIRRALAESLPGLTAAATAEALHGRPFAPELDRIRRELGDDALTHALGREGAHALERLVGTFADHVRGRADHDAVRAAVARFDEALVERGLGYRVEAIDLGTTTLGLLTFEVRSVSARRIDDRSVRLLLAERLDALNVDSAIFGFVPRDADVIVVPIDRAEALAATVVAPLLEEPPHPSLTSPRVTVQRYPWLEPTHASARVFVDREAGVARCGSALATTVALLAERRRLVLEWSGVLVSRGGVEVAQPDGYRIDLERYRRYEAVNPRFRAFERVHDALGERPTSEAIACVRDRIVAAALHGLAQRYVDVRRTEPIPLHSSLLAFASNDLVQGATHGSTDGTTLAARAALASVAGDASTSGLALTLLLRCFTDGGRCNRDTENAARVTFGEIGRELAIPGLFEPPFLGAPELAAIYRELARRDEATIARAARAAFVRLFGDAPAVLR